MEHKGIIIPQERVEQAILPIRNEKVILDADLAVLYGVTTKRLNEQVRRNRKRFPEDFIFRLSPVEKAQVVANCDHLAQLRFSPSLPWAFTEHGALMASSVLNTPRAVEMSVFVVRAFVRLRRLFSTHKNLAEKLSELERRLSTHDRQIVSIVQAIKQLAAPPDPPKRQRIGF